jgi:hypothetical protein
MVSDYLGSYIYNCPNARYGRSSGRRSSWSKDITIGFWGQQKQNHHLLPYCFLVIWLSLVLAVPGPSLPSLPNPGGYNNVTHFNKEIRGRRQCNLEIMELLAGHPVQSTSYEIYEHGIAVRYEQA